MTAKLLTEHHLEFSKLKRGVVVSYKQKYVYELMVNRLFRLAQEKVWLGDRLI